jgi:hypothetical protein
MEAPPQQVRRDPTRSRDAQSRGTAFSVFLPNVTDIVPSQGTEASEDLEDDVVFEEDPADMVPPSLELVSFGTDIQKPTALLRLK